MWELNQTKQKQSPVLKAFFAPGTALSSRFTVTKFHDPGSEHLGDDSVERKANSPSSSTSAPLGPSPTVQVEPSFRAVVQWGLKEQREGPYPAWVGIASRWEPSFHLKQNHGDRKPPRTCPLVSFTRFPREAARAAATQSDCNLLRPTCADAPDSRCTRFLPTCSNRRACAHEERTGVVQIPRLSHHRSTREGRTHLSPAQTPASSPNRVTAVFLICVQFFRSP